MIQWTVLSSDCPRAWASGRLHSVTFCPYLWTMTPHAKKLIGAILSLIWLVIYALFATGLAVRILPHATWYVSLLFYALAGLLWMVPIGLALPWMYAEPKR